MIIVLTGYVRCGKDAVAKYLEDKYGFDSLVYSSILQEECLKRGLSPIKDNFTKIAGELRQKHGMGVLGKLMGDRIREDNTVLSGGRSPEEITELKKRFKSVIVIEVYADAKIRFARRTELDAQTRDAFFARDKVDSEKYGMDKLIKMADYRVENNTDFATLFNGVDKLMKKLNIKPVGK